MLAKTDDQTPVPLSQRDKRLLVCAVVFILGYLVYLTMFSRGPEFYSFEEYARAKVTCGTDESEQCQIRALKKWRKDNPHSPRGDGSAN